MTSRYVFRKMSRLPEPFWPTVNEPDAVSIYVVRLRDSDGGYNDSFVGWVWKDSAGEWSGRKGAAFPVEIGRSRFETAERLAPRFAVFI